MGREKTQQRPQAMAIAAAVLLCLSPHMTIAADTLLNNEARYLNNVVDQSEQTGHVNRHPGTPMVLDPVMGAFDFDLGGSETRKLQLQLSHPLTLETGSYFQSSPAGSNLLGLDAVLRMPVGHGLSLQGGAQQILSNTEFHTLGSIQCMNGTLGPGSYTASGCRFINDADSTFDRRTLSLGGSHEIGNFTTALSWFTTESQSTTTGANQINHLNRAAPLLNPQLMAPFSSESLLAGELPSGNIDSHTSGIDLSFQLGFATGQAGEMRLGLALTRVLDANFQGIYRNDFSPLNWNTAESFDTASLGIQWTHGPFSTGFRGFYREPVNFLNHESSDSMSTFDVHFTWRAPWNANLSVGASNVLGNGVSERNSIDKTSDRFESIYGRIPYVRYQQDL